MPKKGRVRFADTVEGDQDPASSGDGRSAPKRRRVNQSDEHEEPDPGEEIHPVDEEERSEEDGSNRDKKHTLDSDEEYEPDNYKRLDMRKVEGQEDATDEYDGSTKLMPFNMKEDLEEGHFDNTGNFIYDKKDVGIKDAWLDNVNWDNIKNSAGKLWQKKDDEMETSETPIDVTAVYSRLLELLHGKETVAEALKRLNSEKGLSAAEERKRRWAAKKAGTVVEDSQAAVVTELTSLADSLVSLGHMEAYQLNAEKIRSLQPSAPVPEANFDMFGDEQLPESSSQQVTTQEPEQMMWEYRLKDDKSEKIYGPLSTMAIAEKVTSAEEFKGGALARRVGTENFHDIARIDFDLYE